MKIFISYAREDNEIALKLYQDLKKYDVDPWIDSEKLLPGQSWKDVINKEIKSCTYFFALISSNSLSKKGFVQKELKTALKFFDEYPELGKKLQHQHIASYLGIHRNILTRFLYKI